MQREHRGNETGEPRPPAGNRLAVLGNAVGHCRFIVLVPVVAVLMVAFSLFLLGTIHAAVDIWLGWAGLFHGQTDVPKLSAEFLKTVSVMLEAVVFFLIGVGLYSLFIAPLNLAVALGVETLNDLEERIISLVITVLGVTFLRHFIEWKEPLQTLQFGGALALVVVAFVLFLFHSHRSNEEEKVHAPHTQDRSRRDMFELREEQHDIKPDDIAGEEAAHSAPASDR